ncbi:MAG TPA: GntR family transcriptional regulator [Planctomycetota bacterium]|nr:GntR family transcriptional regulator [Planctomycetota bacterium]
MLEFRIVPGSVTPIYKQLVDQVRWAVFSGAHQPGTPLPSVRAVAEQLVINPNTVAKAYTELSRDGVIESRAGKGCFVAARRQIFSNAERSRRIQDAAATFVNEAACLGFSPDEIRAALERRLRQFSEESSR